MCTKLDIDTINKSIVIVTEFIFIPQIIFRLFKLNHLLRGKLKNSSELITWVKVIKVINQQADIQSIIKILIPFSLKSLAPPSTVHTKKLKKGIINIKITTVNYLFSCLKLFLLLK